MSRLQKHSPRSVGTVLTGVLLTLAGGCTKDSEAGGPYLLVQRSSIQPVTPAFQSTVAIQANGGDLLRVRTVGGVHRTNADNEVSELSCISDWRAGEPLYLSVNSTETETLVYVDLIDSSGTSMGGGGGGMPKEGSCTGLLMLSRIVPIQNAPVGASTPGEGGQGGAEQ